MQVLLGADPEVFVSRNGKPFSAHGMVPGTKEKPYPVPNGAVQVDGLALEFNISPSKSEDEFVHNITSVFATLGMMIPKDCRIEVVPSVHFDWDHLKAQPEEALALGCDPDFNAYTMDVNTPPDGRTNLRTAAGHIHVGWTTGAEPQDPMHFGSCADLVKQLDYYLGLPSLLLDGDAERRKLYGKAGCFRPKSYGAEYRVLSNFWLKTPKLMAWVYNTTQLAVKELMTGHALSRQYGQLAQQIIDGPELSEKKIARVIKDVPELWATINTLGGLVEEQKVL